jgi:signal transduction histidine kinase
MNFSFKDRIALYYMLATASVIAVVFLIIFFVVEAAVYQELDADLSFEAHKHTKEILIEEDLILFKNKNEWTESEHREVQVNPVFIQLVTPGGKTMDKSPNLKEDQLVFVQEKAFDSHFDTELKSQSIRQVQLAVQQSGELKGYILAAMSLEGPKIVIQSLKRNLLMLFPLVLLGLFFITRFLAGKSIQPVQLITATTNRITRNNLNDRIPLPENKDELYTLTSSINELLARMQEAIEREKQFTADASHQLRTPLAVLKGTLEVLVRKKRSPEEYQGRIGESIQEIDRISVVVDQLLLLARFDEKSVYKPNDEIPFETLLDDILTRYKQAITDRKLLVDVIIAPCPTVFSVYYYVDVIIENIVSNAIKYASPGSTLTLSVFREGEKVVCQIKDEGIGIDQAELGQIFHPFFRSAAVAQTSVKGNGLGLSIVKKACNLLGVEIQVESELNKGTTFSLYFPV